MKRITSLVVLSAATVGSAMLQPAQHAVSVAQVLPQQETIEAAPDTRVQTALDSLGFNYEIQDNGFIKVGMRLGDDRAQVAYIASGANTLGEMEVRAIASPVTLTEGPLSSEMANRLLKDNANKKLGAWQIVELQDQRNLTLFTAQIEANSSPEQLRSALYAVLATADEMEAELTEGDRF